MAKKSVVRNGSARRSGLSTGNCRVVAYRLLILSRRLKMNYNGRKNAFAFYAAITMVGFWQRGE